MLSYLSILKIFTLQRLVNNCCKVPVYVFITTHFLHNITSGLPTPVVVGGGGGGVQTPVNQCRAHPKHFVPNSFLQFVFGQVCLLFCSYIYSHIIQYKLNYTKRLKQTTLRCFISHLFLSNITNLALFFICLSDIKIESQIDLGIRTNSYVVSIKLSLHRYQ